MHQAKRHRNVDVVFRFARDSPLEGSGFELSVPLAHLPQTRPSTGSSSISTPAFPRLSAAPLDLAAAMGPSTCCGRRIRHAAACLPAKITSRINPLWPILYYRDLDNNRVAADRQFRDAGGARRLFPQPRLRRGALGQALERRRDPQRAGPGEGSVAALSTARSISSTVMSGVMMTRTTPVEFPTSDTAVADAASG